MSPRQIVVALALLDLLAWIVSVFTHIGGNVPTGQYVILDLALEVLVLVGLWFMWRVAWLVAVAGEVLGAAFEVAHVIQDGSPRRAVRAPWR
jgi:hypothetical protein